MSIVALRWVDFAVTQLQQLVTNAEPNTPYGGSSLSNIVVGQSSDGSNAKAVKWLGAPVTELDDAGAGVTGALGVSADETKFVGYYTNVPFGVFSPVLWSGAGVSHTILSPFAGFDFAIGPGAVAFPGGSFNLVLISTDGAKVPGTSATSLGVDQATLWTNGTPALLPFPVGLTVGSSANAMDVAGATVLGLVWSDPSNPHACFWNGVKCYPLAGLPTADAGGSAWACLNGTTASSGAIFGYIAGPIGNPNIGPCYWDSLSTASAAGGVTYYGVAHHMAALPGGPVGTINGVAGNLVAGVPVAVGQAEDASGNPRAVRWDGVTITNLGTLPGGHDSSATDVSDDGTVVCGWAFDAAFIQWPVYWDAANAIHKLPTVADPLDPFRGRALGISPDGTLIWGDGDGGTTPPVLQVTIADLFFAPTPRFIDFTQQANRRQFIAINGGAQNLQPDGSGPFAVTPPVFLSRETSDANNFAINKGRGGAFAIIGPDLTNGNTNPPGTSVTTNTAATTVPFSAILGDYLTGNIYAFNPDTLTDNGQPRKWLRRWRALPGDTTSAITFSYLSLDLETGSQIPAGTFPQLVLRWSDDGGKTWSGNRIIPVGATGKTTFTVKANRLGSTKRFGGSTRIFELSSTDPFKVSIISAEVLTK